MSAPLPAGGPAAAVQSNFIGAVARHSVDLATASLTLAWSMASKPVIAVRDKVHSLAVKALSILTLLTVASVSLKYTATLCNLLVFPIVRIVGRVAGGILGAVTPDLVESLASLAQELFRMMGAAVGGVLSHTITAVSGVAAEIFRALGSISARAMNEFAWGIVKGGFSFIWNTSLETWVVVGGVATYFFTAYFGGRILHEVITYFALVAKSKVGEPRVGIQFQSAPSFLTAPVRKILNNTVGRFNKPLLEPKFNEELQTQLDDITHATLNIRKHGGALQNILLEGPPGTGKTMFLSQLAQKAGFNLVTMPGAELVSLMSQGKHVETLRRIFDFAKASTTPTIVFIDEVDTFASSRDEQREQGKFEQARKEALNTFLLETGEGSKNCMIVCATNRANVLDPSFLSRMTRKLHIGPPDYGSRVEILKGMVGDAFEKTPELETCLNAQGIAHLARITKGLTGRALFNLVNILKCKKASTSDNKLTGALINQTAYQFIKQERESPGAIRSWRIIEIISDLWYFTFARYAYAAQEALGHVGGYIKKPFQGLYGKVVSLRPKLTG